MPSRGAFKNPIGRFMSTGGNAKQKERSVNPIPDEQIKQVEAEVIWPPNSPDLNFLEFFFWGYVMQHVYRIS